MNTLEKAQYISDWIKNYAKQAGIESLCVGVSGGVDSALVSTLCAMTGMDVVCCILPINQNKEETKRAENHVKWLQEKYGREGDDNIREGYFDMSDVFETFKEGYGDEDDEKDRLGFANTKARLRMTALYMTASQCNGLVVLTGNKNEDYGVMFFTKWGDNSGDIAPIADLYKSQVYELSRELEINEEILAASPTDGLWDDGRTDFDQLQCTYDQIESVMKGECTDQKIINIYNHFHNKNLHKVLPIPICKIPIDI